MLKDLLENGTKTLICQGMATLYCHCLDQPNQESIWNSLNAVVSNRTDTIVSVFFLYQ